MYNGEQTHGGLVVKVARDSIQKTKLIFPQK